MSQPPSPWRPESYQSLNDAQGVTGDPGLARGRTRIWYVKPEFFRDYIMGYQWLKDQGIPVPDAKTIGRTHVRLGAIKETDPERIYQIMQGEYWSPAAEAREFVPRLGLAHTSMSVGDIVHLADGRLLMADGDGFVELTVPKPNPFVQRHKSVEPILTFAFPEVHKYGEWTLEVSPWPRLTLPTEQPTEWMAKGRRMLRAGAYDEKAVFSDRGKHEALKALKVELDIEEEGDDAVIFWEWLENFIRELRPTTRITREEVARRIELARRQMRSAPARTKLELDPAFEWFYDRPIPYRIAFIERAVEQDRLLHAPRAPPGVPRHGRAPAPNPCGCRPARSHNALKRRLLR